MSCIQHCDNVWAYAKITWTQQPLLIVQGSGKVLLIYLFRFWILERLSWFQNKQWFFSSVMKCQNNIILNQNLILRLKHHNCICTTLPVYWHHLHPKSNHRQFLLRQRLKNYLVEHVNLMMIFLQQGQRSNQVCLLDCFYQKLSL